MSFNIKSLKRPYKTPFSRSVSAERFQRALLNKPPPVAKISNVESYLLRPTGFYGKRICGSKILSLGLPSFVPEGMYNPWGVTNPSEQYVCTKPAGWGTDHVGFGKCKRHDQNKESSSMKTVNMSKVNKVNKKKDKAFSEEIDALLMEIGDFDTYLSEAKARTTPDELLDITRPLYELEALKLMTIEWMGKFGFDEEAINSIAKRIQESANVQLILAKRDHEIIRNKAIASMIKVFVTGILSILLEELEDNPLKAKAIAMRLNEELLLPVQNIGITEVMKKQEVSGEYNKIMEFAEFTEVEE
jgi:hypothetical protein